MLLHLVVGDLVRRQPHVGLINALENVTQEHVLKYVKSCVYGKESTVNISANSNVMLYHHVQM